MQKKLKESLKKDKSNSFFFIWKVKSCETNINELNFAFISFSKSGCVGSTCEWSAYFSITTNHDVNVSGIACIDEIVVND